jgi:hypothetical protein
MSCEKAFWNNLGVWMGVTTPPANGEGWQRIYTESQLMLASSLADFWNAF